MVIATYRDHEITRKHPLFAALGNIGRDTTLHRIALKGLSEDEIATVVEASLGRRLPAGLLGTLTEKTEGNPLFVSEVARILQQEVVDWTAGRLVIEIPEGIQEAIGQRLNRLSDACNELLLVASVLGRRFTVHELRGVLRDSDPLDVLRTLEEAIQGGIIEEHGGGWRFCHVLVRDILYDELSLVRKVTLHGKVADTLVRLRDEGLDHSVGEIARHYYHALQGGQGENAVEYAVRAAEHAAGLAAYDEATAYYQLALEALGMSEGANVDRTAEIHLGMSLSQMTPGRPAADILASLRRCVEAARERQQYDIFAEAACWLEYMLPSVTDAADGYLVLLEEALTYVGEDDPALRAKVLAHLASALAHSQRRREAEDFANQAIVTARASGDPAAECHSLDSAIVVLRTRPEKLSERVRLAEQLLARATEIDDAFMVERALRWLLLSQAELGDMSPARHILERIESLAERFQIHTSRYFAAGHNAYLALFEGRWDDAERFIEEAAGFGNMFEAGSEGVYGAQMFLLNRELGRLPMVRGALERLIDEKSGRVWKPGLLATYSDLGMADEARGILTTLAADDFEPVAQGELYSVCLAYLAEACVELGDIDTARGVYQRFVPFSGQMLLHPTAACYGPADLYLGMLASQMNELSEAETLLARAAALCGAAGPNMWTPHIGYRHAQVLERHNFPGGRARFAEKIEAARASARSLGMTNLLAKLDELEGQGRADGRSKASDLTRRELEVLHLVMQGKSNKQIAAELSRSLATVATHVRSILGKTHRKLPRLSDRR